MTARFTSDTGRALLWGLCALAAFGWITIGTATAQSAGPATPVMPSAPVGAASQPGSLDMGVNAGSSPAPASQNEAGGLDMDVNPNAPAPAATAAPSPAPTPDTAAKSEIRAMSPDNVEVGARIFSPSIRRLSRRRPRASL